MIRKRALLYLLALFVCTAGSAAEFSSSWHNLHDQVWSGPEFWANRLQDWQIRDGRLECTESSSRKPMRTVHLLTHYLNRSKGEVSMQVNTGRINPGVAVVPDAACGFLIGCAPDIDYRGAALVHHSPGPGGGLFAGVDAGGFLFLQNFNEPDKTELARSSRFVLSDNYLVTVRIRPVEGSFELTLEAVDSVSKRVLNKLVVLDVDAELLTGNIALVSHPGSGEQTGTFWFNHLKVSGSKISADDRRRCGPVIATQYTVDDRIMKMTAQLMPVGENANQTVELQVKEENDWQTIATTEIITPGWTAPFRIKRWQTDRDVPYRVQYTVSGRDSYVKTFDFHGTVRRDPVDKETIVLAGFTGNHNMRGGVERAVFDWNENGVWFPHSEMVSYVAAHKPDVLFFSGDQVYEGGSPTGADRSGEWSSFLDYMYKWYLWCWAFRDLSRDIVCVTIPDDHDVYQGNLWGEGGRATDKDDKGGYVMPAEFVKMVERTQTSHLPDPFDPTPIEQGIGVYYTDLTYGRISFAILEDRKFKTGCNGRVPDTGSGRADHVIDPEFDPKSVDVTGAKLLGERQLEFIRDWAADWQGCDMKVSLTQTVFAGMATHHGAGLNYLVADLDSNGWPQSGRNRALAELRKGFTFMVGGDQHLSTIVHHGIDDWNDAGWSFTVPSIANFYPRAWLPPQKGKNRRSGAPEFTGEHLDGLGNKVTVYAVTNPKPMGHEPKALHDRMPGYGIVRFNKASREIEIENWPRFSDPTQSGAVQYEGWPMTISQFDNYKRKPVDYLPTLQVTGLMNPVVQVINESNDEIEYTVRINGTEYKPGIFESGNRYTVKIGDPDRRQMKTLKNLAAVHPDHERVIEVVF